MYSLTKGQLEGIIALREDAEAGCFRVASEFMDALASKDYKAADEWWLELQTGIANWRAYMQVTCIITGESMRDYEDIEDMLGGRLTPPHEVFGVNYPEK